MSASQKIIAAVYAITNKEDYGFYVGEEHALLGKIIEEAELPFEQESFVEVKQKLFTSVMKGALKSIGVEITRSGSYFTVWGPGVRKHE